MATARVTTRIRALREEIARHDHRYYVLGLELAELAYQPIVLGVRDLRVVEHVVAMIVARDLLAQRPDPRLGAGHGSLNRRGGRGRATRDARSARGPRAG